MRGPTRKPPLLDRRVVCYVLRFCSVPPLSRNARFSDGLPDAPSPDGGYADPDAQLAYAHDSIVHAAIAMRNGTHVPDNRGGNRSANAGWMERTFARRGM